MRGHFGVDCSTVWCLVSFPRQRVGTRDQGYGDLQSVKSVGDRALLCLANRFDCVVHLGPQGPNHPPHHHTEEGRADRRVPSSLSDGGAQQSHLVEGGQRLGLSRVRGGDRPERGPQGGEGDEDVWAYVTGAVPKQEGGFQAWVQSKAQNGGGASRLAATGAARTEQGILGSGPGVHHTVTTPLHEGMTVAPSDSRQEAPREGEMGDGELRAYLAHASQHPWPGRVQEGAVELMRAYYEFLVRSGLFPEEDTTNIISSLMRLACSCAKLCLR